MEAKHTKGQWQAQTTKPFIAKVVAFRNGDKLEITQSATNLSDEEAAANANLIASAPEMYNALQKLRSEAESLLNQQTDIHMTEADFIQLCKNFLGATSELCTDTLNKAKGDTSC
jgi:hypothetical protein